ncbi:MAG TPA: hypothetical protein ENN51_04975 [candidate division WOR-3 bacterium]|uniref:Uncharacterized protein n=1 Tax=candidate division WOR-3 bacterium TaxID=2052148 RepID=A0A7V0XFF0_UNCW3|nr:hypothetical protein [candidate division WOR-3 bacterium]
MNLSAVLLAVMVGSTPADTADYSRYVVIVTVSDHRPGTGFDAPAGLIERARAQLNRTLHDRDRTVGDFLAVHDRPARRLGRMTLEHRRGDVRFTSDGTTEADFEFPLTGAVMEQLLPVPGPKRLLGRVACPCCGREWPDEQPVPNGLELVPLELTEVANFTGVLVDVRGLDYQAALFPRIIIPSGDEVYGPAFADKDTVITRGIVGYYKDRNEALQDGRTGSNPLIIRALAVEGPNRCDVKVTDRDAALVHGSQRNLDHLTRCRVGLLVD